jgi:hypothetical protein
MKPELHPDAAKNFNDKARALQDMVGPMTEALPSEMPTHIARPGAPAHLVSEGELFDFKITGLQDQLGRTTARYFEHQGRRFGLEGLPRAVRVVVIISGMCRKGAPDQGRGDSGCAGR